MGDVFDGFGMVCMAHFRGESSNHVTERDDGYVNEVDGAYYFRSFEGWPEYEQRGIQEARGRVLDVGLGAGRHSLWLQERGHEVVGIDVSPLALEVSRLRGVRDCRLMDVREMAFPDASFDTVLLLGANLGIMGDVDEIRGALEGLHRVTAEDGIIVGSSRDPVKTEDPAHLAYHEMNRRRGRPPGLVRIRIGFRGKFGEWFHMLWMSQEELAEIIEPTGWNISKVFSSGPDYVAVLGKS
jgi:SAM-dependent methyltransferase